MKTDYAGHDHAYIKKKARGDDGWASTQVSESNFNRINASLKEVDLTPKSILDLGCGSGDMTAFYSGICSDIHGVDISPHAIEWARERCPDAKFTVANLIESFPFERKFHLAIDSNCLHCIIGSDRQQFLNTVYALLEDDGYFIVHTMCNEPIGDLLKGYDSKTQVIFHGDLATRYLGKSASILNEIEGANLSLVSAKVYQQDNASDILVAIHQKRVTQEAL